MARQGQGFAAERANHIDDVLSGKDTRLLGDDNTPNGADRIVDGQLIQTKYCNTGARCIEECFNKKGEFRYMDNNGKPMQIEVPLDKYDSAVETFAKKISEGKVPGVTDPNKAAEYVKKGHYSYQQAKNIAKGGNIDSIIYDAKTGVITAANSFGISATIGFATSIWNGEEVDIALERAVYSGLQVGGTAMLTTILSGQAMKLGVNSLLVSGTEQFVTNVIGTKGAATIANTLLRTSGQSAIYGSAATKSVAKFLSGNIVTGAATFTVLSVGDVANIFSGRISGGQLFKNMAKTASSIAGGAVGALAGSVIPVVGTFVGGLIGAAIASSVTDSVVGVFVEEDADEMVVIIQEEFQILASEYLLGHKEAEKCVEELQAKLDGSTLKDMFASSERRNFARGILSPIIKRQVYQRQRIEEIKEEDMVQPLQRVLEQLSEEVESEVE